jgi:hypothetical protein
MQKNGMAAPPQRFRPLAYRQKNKRLPRFFEEMLGKWRKYQEIYGRMPASHRRQIACRWNAKDVAVRASDMGQYDWNMELTANNIGQIRNICQRHHVATLYLFGSAVSGNLKEGSDLDFLVKFQHIDLSEYFDNYLALKEALKALFSREIDLVEEQSLKNPILIKSIENGKQLIYG